MAAPSSIDVTAPFDPTAYFTLTGAQIYQLVSGVYPYSDKGFVVKTTDVVGVPEVPNAAVTTKWQNYIWLRITATAAIPYIWNPAAASDATYLKWQTVAASSIGARSITGGMIALNTILSENILNLDYTKLFNVPGGLPPSGAAGGDLTGTYPNPSIATDAVTTSKVAAAQITNAKLEAASTTTGIVVPDKIRPAAVGSQQIRTNAGATATEWFTPQKIVNTTNPTSGDALKFVRVNAAETGFELASTGTIYQRISKIAAGGVQIADGGTNNIPFDNSAPQITEGVELVSQAITPTANNTLIRVTFSCFGGTNTGGKALTVALFEDGSSDSLQAVAMFHNDGADVGAGTIDYIMVSGTTSPITFSIRAGPDNGADGFVNRSDVAALYGGAALSILTVEEFQGTLS